MTFRVLSDLGQRVLHGAGAVNQVPMELDALGATRILVVASRTIEDKTPLSREMERLLGGRKVATYAGIGAHTPEEDVLRCLGAAEDARVDGILSIGGGAVVDGVKHVVYNMSRGLRDPPPKHVALPTTLSGAEFTHLAGITRKGLKEGISDKRLIPDVVVLDPGVQVWTPRDLWAATGVRSLDHAIEGYLTNDAGDPLVERFCVEAIRELRTQLPQSFADADDLDAASACQLAEWKASSGITRAKAGSGLSHKLGKALGATYGIQHGVTSALTLPAVLRHLATKAPANMVRVSEALGGRAPEDAASQVDALLDTLRIQRKKLRAYGVKREDLPRAVTYAVGTADPAVLRLLESLW